MKSLKKEPEKDIRKWKAFIPYSWIGRNNIVKIIILSKTMYIFKQSQLKFPPHSSEENKNILNFIGNHNKSKVA